MGIRSILLLTSFLAHWHLFQQLQQDSLFRVSDSLYIGAYDSLLPSRTGSVVAGLRGLDGLNPLTALDVADTLCSGSCTVMAGFRTTLEPLALALQDSFSVSPGLYAELLALANQCPLEYGPAVFQAQAWIWSIDPMAWFSNPCERGDLNSGKVEYVDRVVMPTSDQWNLYPNPAMDEIHLMNEGVLESCTVRIMNGIGSIVFEGEYASSVDISISVSNYPRGAYLIQIETISGRISRLLVLE